jgi:hypothetical protein
MEEKRAVVVGLLGIWSPPQPHLHAPLGIGLTPRMLTIDGVEVGS